ncbi:hypothetical protein GWI33_002877 [Rhynchophorus ferrugineus]|uniref:Uncharacterized protein n=1 Tax=Rhynchophorus ferrugineus TaxID=354439 RepID=A0A834IP31_RHYFE|nr:hypothetical protein GWI33_002877 [Rhynchophorus ferrugineus]
MTLRWHMFSNAEMVVTDNEMCEKIIIEAQKKAKVVMFLWTIAIQGIVFYQVRSSAAAFSSPPTPHPTPPPTPPPRFPNGGPLSTDASSPLAPASLGLPPVPVRCGGVGTRPNVSPASPPIPVALALPPARSLDASLPRERRGRQDENQRLDARPPKRTATIATRSLTLLESIVHTSFVRLFLFLFRSWSETSTSTVQHYRRKIRTFLPYRVSYYHFHKSTTRCD